MCLVALAYIGAPHGVIKQGGGLVLIISPSVKIIKLKANTCLFVHIYSEQSLKMVFSIGAVTAAVERYIGYRRKCIGKTKFRRRRYEIPVWLRKRKERSIITVCSNTRDTRRSQVSRGIIFTIPACGKD